jgi:integrase
VIGLRNRRHVDLLRSCGLRGGEAVALDVSDLDLDARTLLTGLEYVDR